MSSSTAGRTVKPGSFSSVFVCFTGSTTLRFVRVSPSIKVNRQSTPGICIASAMQRPVAPPSRPMAVLVPPSAATTLETFSPLPPGSVRMAVTRLTVPGENPGIRAVLSSAGLSVTVWIIALPPAGAARTARM
ncbi:MAG: hypothetical protein SO044_09690 [Agathobaculum sp.]|nr:hypothetical protein [Agathobaculum sp.]